MKNALALLMVFWALSCHAQPGSLHSDSLLQFVDRHACPAHICPPAKAAF